MADMSSFGVGVNWPQVLARSAGNGGWQGRTRNFPQPIPSVAPPSVPASGGSPGRGSGVDVMAPVAPIVDTQPAPTPGNGAELVNSVAPGTPTFMHPGLATSQAPVLPGGWAQALSRIAQFFPQWGGRSPMSWGNPTPPLAQEGWAGDGAGWGGATSTPAAGSFETGLGGATSSPAASPNYFSGQYGSGDMGGTNADFGLSNNGSSSSNTSSGFTNADYGSNQSSTNADQPR